MSTLTRIFVETVHAFYAEKGGKSGAVTVVQRTSSDLDVGAIYVSAASDKLTTKAKLQIEALVRERRRIAPGQANDFAVQDMKEISNTLGSVTGALTALLGAIAGVSLLVGAIGIAVAHGLIPALGDAAPAQMRSFLASQTYVPNAHATFLVDRDACPVGTSSMFPCGPAPGRIAALSFNSHKRQCGSALPPGKELVSVFLTADESRSLIGASEHEIHARAWPLARAFCPELPEIAAPFRAIARAEAIPVHAVGRYRKAAALRSVARGPVAFAGDYLTTATVDGALRSGLQAAEQLAG